MTEAQRAIVEIQLDKIAQLFDTLDPQPFRERDLDRDAEEFIVDWAQELPRRRQLCLRIHLPESESSRPEAHELGAAIKAYFHHRANAVRVDMKELFRFGRYSLAIGLLVLAACLVVGQLLSRTIASPEIGRFLSESLVILGWVANWQPIEIFLYQWWPLARQRNLYRRLSEAEIILAPRATTVPRASSEAPATTR